MKGHYCIPLVHILFLCCCNLAVSSIIAFIGIQLCLHYHSSCFLFIFFFSCFSFLSLNVVFLFVLVLLLHFGGHCYFFALERHNIVDLCWSWFVMFGTSQHWCCLCCWFVFEWCVLVSLNLVLACLTKTYCFNFLFYF